MTDAPLQPRDAATVMLVRDTPAGIEVFMLRRNLNSDFVGGAYVFPGGAVDEADRHDDLTAICEGRTDADASAALGIERGGLAYWVAAVRECFEEAGVLLATGPDGDVVSLADPEVAERFRLHRLAVNDGTGRLAEVCVDEGLQLDVGRIHYFSHWITPVGPPRRFDTRFFVADAPPEQVPLHDEGETIANLWVRPADALARHESGELDMILPTIRNLEAIAGFERSADLLVAAASQESVPAILPRITTDADGLRVLLPGEPGYDEAMADPPSMEGVPMAGRPGGPTRP